MSHQTKKSLGQHFLADPGMIEKIVRAVDPRPGQRLVEIGPGAGAITRPLLQRQRTLTVIEFDRDLIEPLAAMGEELGAELTIVHADVLAVDFTELAGTGLIRLVGNLPYNISSPILFHCLDHAASIQDMHFMLQKEVVERMASGPGSKVYGRLSVMLQAFAQVTPLFEVPPDAFDPPPKVDSAVVRMVPLPACEVAVRDRAVFASVVRDAFGQRRKTLRNALGRLCSAEDIEAAGLQPGARAEQVEVAGFVGLANHLSAPGSVVGGNP